MDIGAGRHPQIDLLAAHRHPDPPVLGQPPLGDVELGHDLQARNDGRAQTLRRRRLDLAERNVAIGASALSGELVDRKEQDAGLTVAVEIRDIGHEPPDRCCPQDRDYGVKNPRVNFSDQRRTVASHPSYSPPAVAASSSIDSRNRDSKFSDGITS